MAGGADAAEEAKLTGMSKIFNGTTMKGRANVIKFKIIINLNIF